MEFMSLRVDGLETGSNVRDEIRLKPHFKISPMHQPVNFGGNIRVNAQKIFEPRTEEEVVEVLNRNRTERVRVIGRLHSWSEVVQAGALALNLHHLNQVTIEDGHVHIGAGCQIKSALANLSRHGKTLPSVGFIAEQSIAGAISTGTHGSGRHSLSHYVTGVRFARFDTTTGEPLIEEFTDGDELLALRCSLGTLGVILRVTMQCRDEYLVEESFREYDELRQVLSQETEYPLQQFYLIPWRWSYVAQHRRESTTAKSKMASVYRWYRFVTFDVGMHILILAAIRLLKSFATVRFLFRHVLPRFVLRGWRVTDDATSQLVMKHDLFRHIEIEFFVRSEKLPAAMEFVRSLIDSLGISKTEVAESFIRQLTEAHVVRDWEEARGAYCHHYPICIRKVLADQTLVSMASRLELENDSPQYDRSEADKPHAATAWYSVSLISYQHPQQRDSFREFAKILAECVVKHFDARLHWGKYFPLSDAAARKCYPAMTRFCEIRSIYDPNDRFLNDWTSKLFGNKSAHKDRASPEE